MSSRKPGAAKTPRLCRNCGETYYSRDWKTLHCGKSCAQKTRLKENPQLAQALREGHQKYFQSEEGQAMSSKHLKQLWQSSSFREENRKRMTENNPSKNSESIEKAKETKRRKGVTYEHLTGGNGTGLTLAEKLLSEALGWETQLAVRTGQKKGSGYPYHYKLDVANLELRIGVECDGQSHFSRERKKQDEKKTLLLESLGWTILRFWNHEIENDLEGCLEKVREQVRMCTTLKQGQETTLQAVS